MHIYTSLDIIHIFGTINSGDVYTFITESDFHNLLFSLERCRTVCHDHKSACTILRRDLRIEKSKMRTMRTFADYTTKISVQIDNVIQLELNLT